MLSIEPGKVITGYLKVTLFFQMSYIILLWLLTHFVLTELKPLASDGISGISVYEWTIYIWMFALVSQEIEQVCQI